MISFAKYLEEENNYVWSIYNLEGPSQPYTDFKITSVIFDGSWGTTAQNIYGPAEMGTYAGMADIYYYANGGGNDGNGMMARFDCWTGSTCVSGRNGSFATPTTEGDYGNIQHPYLTFKSCGIHADNVIVALNFHTDRQRIQFKNHFYALFPKSRPNSKK